MSDHRHPRCVTPSSGAPVTPVTTGGELAAARRALEAVADRAVTIADEAFGIGPVEPIDDTLTRIKLGLHQRATSAYKAACKISELEAEVERLLCWTVGAYVDGEMEPAHADRFRAHLAGCEACRREVADTATTTARLSGLKERTDG